MACDSEWTYCLEQNKTKRADCVGSCLSYNGYCDDDSVCVTAIDEDTPKLKCLDSQGKCKETDRQIQEWGEGLGI